MNFVFFLLAVLTVGSLVMIAYAIAVNSLIWIVLSILGVFVFMGLGFTLKRRVQTPKS